jgi:STE24 endopeptidase
MTGFSILFLIVLVSGLFIEYWLIWRQSSYVASHRKQVPATFAQKIDLKEHQKAADYTLAKLSVEKISLAVSAILLLIWTLGGGLDILDSLWQTTHWSLLWQGVGLIISLLLISSVLDLPISLWRTFGIEAKFGFNRTTGKRFVTDLLLQLGLMLLIGLPLVALVLWLMEKTGSYWWLWVWLVWMSFILFISWAYPVVIAPLFNKFKPLEDDSLRNRLQALLERCGFSSDGMFVMDGSRRSAHGNAYFTGFGRNKRIVFFDTLLSGLEAEEIEAVLAHELGHFRHKHVLKMMLTTALLSLLGLALLGWLMHQSWFFTGLGVSRQTPALGLILFLLVIPVFTIFLTPVMSALSRRHEFQADDYAAANSSGAALINGLVKMYKDNASTLTPDPLYSAFHHSHPPASVRIAHLSSIIDKK